MSTIAQSPSLSPLPQSTGPQPLPIIRIRPSKGKVSLQLADLWEYRELLFFLTWKDIKVRYKQTVLGVAWAVLQPLMSVFMFSIFFGRLAKIPSDGLPYPVFNMAAMVPWTLFAFGLAQCSNSLVGNQNLLKKVYFPRLMIPLSSLLAGLVDFLVAFVLLLGMMGYYHIIPTLNIIWLPFFVVLTVTTSLGVGLWLSALNVNYRDVKYLVPFLVQFWMLATPIAYPSSLLNAYPTWKLLYGLNPMVGVVEGFRWALLGTASQPGPMFFASTAASIAILFGGYYYFRRTEKTFADTV